MTARDTQRWMLKSAVAGGTVWIVVAAKSLGDAPWLSEYEVLFLLAPLVITPLALGLAAGRLGERVPQSFAFAYRVQLVAACFAVAAFAFTPGRLAGALTLPWLAVCMLVAISALDVLRLRWASAEEAITKAGMLYLAVGGAALTLSRAGIMPLHFNEPIVLLTAVHFHFTGFATPVFTASLSEALSGVARSSLHRRSLSVAALTLICATPLLAVGWVLDSPAWKLVCVLALVSSLTILAVLALRIAAAAQGLLPRILLAFSACSVLFGMVLAGLYGVSEFTGHSLITLQAMARLHGTANGLGFSLCGLLTLNLWEAKRLKEVAQKEANHDASTGRNHRAEDSAELVA